MNTITQPLKLAFILPTSLPCTPRNACSDPVANPRNPGLVNSSHPVSPFSP